MMQATPAPTTFPPDANTLPAMPPPRVSASELAAQLPELWRAHDEADKQSVKYRDGEALLLAARRHVAELAARIDALEIAAMEAPAQNLADAVTQLLLLVAGLEVKDNMESEARALAGALRVILPMCSVNFAGLVSAYAPGLGLEAVQ